MFEIDKCFAIFVQQMYETPTSIFPRAQGSLIFAERPRVGNSDLESSTKTPIPTSISILLFSTFEFWNKKWLHKVKLLEAHSQTVNTSRIYASWSAHTFWNTSSTASKSKVHGQKLCFCYYRPGPPPVLVFHQHGSETADLLSEIDAFSFRVLCTTL